MKNQKNKRKQKNQTILLHKEIQDQLRIVKSEGAVALGMIIILIGVMTLFIFIAEETILNNIFQFLAFAVIFFMVILIIAGLLLYIAIKTREKKLTELME